MKKAENKPETVDFKKEKGGSKPLANLMGENRT